MKYSKLGYKKNSPDKNRPFNVIPSGDITMNNVPYPVFGMDDTGASQYMLPGFNYHYPGSTVLEIPVKMQAGGQNVASIAKQQFGDNNPTWVPPNTPETNKMVFLTDLANYSLASGVNPASTKQGRILYSSEDKVPGTNTSVRSLYDALNIFNQRSDIKQLSPEQRLDLFYNKLYSSDQGIQDFKSRVKNLGYGTVPFFRGSPDNDIQNLLNPTSSQPPQTIAIKQQGGEHNPIQGTNNNNQQLSDYELKALQNFFKQKFMASKTNQNPLGQKWDSQTNTTTPTPPPAKVMDPFWGVAGVTGLSFIANALQNNQYPKDIALQRQQGLTDNIGPVVPGDRGDYSTNEGFYKPDRFTPVQFRALNRAKNGGYFDQPQDYTTLDLPSNYPELPTAGINNTDPQENIDQSDNINIDNFKSGINNIELSGNRKGYNVNHNNGSSAFGPYGFLANPKAALGSIYKKYFQKDMTFQELVNKMKQDGAFQEKVMNLHSQGLLNQYGGNPFAAAMEHFAGPRAADKFVHGNLNLDDRPGNNNVTYRTYLNKFSKGAGLNERFQVGGEYNVTPDELMSIIANGGQMELV